MSDLNTKNRMPVVFIGHGSPMNAIEQNNFTNFLKNFNLKIPTPKYILCISAHWMTNGTWVTEMQKPKTIHDFYGFPQALFDVQYPAPGAPEVAELIKNIITSTSVQGDLSEWGLDHGTWSILKHMYPKADIPVLQLSIDINKPPEYHYEIGHQISKLRDHGVLILGSGNIVHNLRKIKWEPNAKPFDWATESDLWVKHKLEQRDFKSVINDFHKTEAGKLSVPTMEHFYPLNYILGASEANDELHFDYEEIQNGSISMRSVRLG
jgi:4,5-DOPA dioxygenase extradiol